MEKVDGGSGEARPRVSRSNKSNISPVNPNPLVPVVHSRGEDGVPGKATGGRTRGRLIRQYLVVTIFNFCLSSWIFICELETRPTLQRDFTAHIRIPSRYARVVRYTFLNIRPIYCTSTL